MNVAVFGLGKLGQPMAVVLARAGHQVTAYDVNPEVSHEVGRGRATVDEPMLAEEMAECGDSLTTSALVEECVSNSDIAYVIVPTPSQEDGSFTNRFVIEAVTGIGEALSGREGPYTVVICSTMMPGSTDGEVKEALEASAGRHVDLVYSPQFIALGSVLHDMRNPDVFLVGTDSTSAYMQVEEIAKTVFDDPDSVYVAWLTPTEAEIVKIGINTYITMKISFANALGWVCGNVPGVDGYRVTRTIGQDSRIGSKYILSGGPYGGPCFPRDTDAFAAFVKEATGTDNWAGLAIETAGLNDDIIKFTVKTAVAAANDESRDRESSILLLGTGYKPASPVTEESFAFRVAEALEREVTSMGLEFEIFGHDATADVPWGVSRLTEGAAEAKAAREDVVTIICSPEPQFAQMDFSTVVDVWGIVPDENADTLINYRGGNGAHLLINH
mgnify:CR=1 FL=1